MNIVAACWWLSYPILVSLHFIFTHLINQLQKVCLAKFHNFNFWQFFKICNFDYLMWITSVANHEAVGCMSERRRSSCSSSKLLTEFQSISNLWLLIWNTQYKLINVPFAMPQGPDKSTLFHVRAWCYQASSHYLKQCWPSSMLLYDTPWGQWVKWICGPCLSLWFSQGGNQVGSVLA